MPLEIDEILVAHLRHFITQKMYDKLFSQGACFHFAIRAFRKGIGQLHYIPSSCGDPSKMDHVFLQIDDGQVFDRRGCRSLDDLLQERKAVYAPRPIDEATITAHIASLAVPPELNEEIYHIADNLIQQLRESSANPPN